MSAENGDFNPDMDKAKESSADMGEAAARYAEGAGKMAESMASGETPSESKFNNMEVAAAAGGAEAEARRREMGKWSEATGRYAEETSKASNKNAERLVNEGRSEERIKKEQTDLNEHMAGNGVMERDSRDASVRPSESGMVKEVDGRGSVEYKSPGQFRKTEKGSEDQAA